MISYFIVVGYQSVPELYHCKSKNAFSYNPDKKVYIYNCSGSQETSLPEHIPHLANWVIFDNNMITDLCGHYHYLHDEKYNVTELSIASSGIKRICNKCESKSLDSLLTGHSLTLLNLSGNEFELSKTFNESMKNMGRTQLLLGGNTTICDCSAMWLAGWLNSSRTVSGKRLVKDFANVTCATGKPGFSVYKLKSDEDYWRGIGCYPANPVRVWILGATGLIGGLLLLITICVIIVRKYRKLLKWRIYKHFGILVGGRIEKEDLERLEFDAFLSYR